MDAKGAILAAEHNSQKFDNQAVKHAEIKALIAANTKIKSRKLVGATAYCSCEPCAMCLAALSYAKVERILFRFSMLELFPDDPQGAFDSREFIKTLNHQPFFEQLMI